MSIGEKIEGASYKYSDKEKAVVAILRMNASMPKREINIKKRIGRVEVEFHWRSSKSLWGRFGGGWNWKIGAEWGSTTIILNLLIFYLRFSWGRP